MRIASFSIVIIPLLAACVAPTPGAVRQVPDPASTRYINPGTLAALPGFTHAVRIGPTLYVSGEAALDSTGRLVGPGVLGAQAAQAFANLATDLRIGGRITSRSLLLALRLLWKPPIFPSNSRSPGSGAISLLKPTR